MVAFSPVVGLTIIKLVYFLDDLLSYIIVLIQITSNKCNKVCVCSEIHHVTCWCCTQLSLTSFHRTALQRLLLDVEINNVPWPPTDQGQVERFHVVNALSWNRTSWLNRLLANPWRGKNTVSGGSWGCAVEMGQCWEEPQALEIYFRQHPESQLAILQTWKTKYVCLSDH